MKKIICIGECSLNIVFEHGQPVGSMPGGRIMSAAMMMAREQLPVVMASETAADAVGDMLAKALTDAGVDTTSLDRFTEGRTPLNIMSPGADGLMTVTRYEKLPDEAFDIVWPRVDDDTVVVFGGYYSIDARTRNHMQPFLSHCSERGAVMVYLPGFMPVQESRITRVMPTILENLELADLVIARDTDLKMIFGVDRGSKCFADHIDFYCRSMVNVDTVCHRLDYFSGKDVTQVAIPESVGRTMTWNAGVLAGIVGKIYAKGLTPADFNAPGPELRQELLEAALDSATVASQLLTQEWQMMI